MLKLMYITNNPTIAEIAQNSGVDIVFVDMEYIGKEARQGGMNTVMSHHTIDDVKAVRQSVAKGKLLVRINPIHEETSEYCSSEQEIASVISAGADLIMLPFFKTASEVERFVSSVAGRAKTVLLLETPEAVDAIDSILDVEGIDEIHIGLNDLSLGYGMKFMFEPLANGMVQTLCEKFKEKGIPYGFGGIASIGKGMLPSEMIIKEHYRLGSGCCILSRSFCNVNNFDCMETIKNIFEDGVGRIRDFESQCRFHLNNPDADDDFFESNRKAVEKLVKKIVAE